MKSKHKTILIVSFLFLPVLHLLIFSYIPIIANFVLSFTNWKGIGSLTFIGLRNYKKSLTDPQYILMFKNCGWYFLVAIPQLVLAFL